MPLFVIAFVLPGDGWRLFAFGIFVIAGVSDWLDGFAARKLKAGSDFGRMLDPIADKVLVAVALMMLVAEGLFTQIKPNGMLSLLKAMQESACQTLVFSSSATVYGDSSKLPITEDCPRSHTSPYGHTKLICEDMIAALQRASGTWRTGVLRYFNPVGAHPSGLIGEAPLGTPNNLLPFVAQVAAGLRPTLKVYGNDFATPDGTGVRDYIHVQDLAQGHVAALAALLRGQASFTVNLGTGRGHSVLEVVRAFELASGRPVPWQFAPRRLHGTCVRCPSGRRN